MTRPGLLGASRRTFLGSVMAMTLFATSTTALAGEVAAQAAAPARAASPAQAAAPARAATPTQAVAPGGAGVALPTPAAQAPAPAVQAPAPAAQAPAPVEDGPATPLAVRPTQATPLALAASPEGVGLGYKLLALLAIGGGVALYLYRKRGALRPGGQASQIDILARVGLGVRSELVLVEVEGTRLLVGMTPSAIQTLAVLDTSEEVGEAAPEDVGRPINLGERVRSLLGTDGPASPLPTPIKPAAAARPRVVRPNARAAQASAKASSVVREVPGQARGLLLSADEGE